MAIEIHRNARAFVETGRTIQPERGQLYFHNNNIIHSAGATCSSWPEAKQLDSPLVITGLPPDAEVKLLVKMDPQPGCTDQVWIDRNHVIWREVSLPPAETPEQRREKARHSVIDHGAKCLAERMGCSKDYALTQLTKVLEAIEPRLAALREGGAT